LGTLIALVGLAAAGIAAIAGFGIGSRSCSATCSTPPSGAWSACCWWCWASGWRWPAEA